MITADQVTENPKHEIETPDPEYVIRETPGGALDYVSQLNHMHAAGYEPAGLVGEFGTLYKKARPTPQEISTDYLEKARLVIREECVKILTELKEQK